MTSILNFDEAVELLKKIVKFSEVKNQKHIDLSLCLAEDRAQFQKALMIVNLEVEKGSLKREELLTKLGIE